MFIERWMNTDPVTLLLGIAGGVAVISVLLLIAWGITRIMAWRHSYMLLKRMMEEQAYLRREYQNAHAEILQEAVRPHDRNQWR